MEVANGFLLLTQSSVEVLGGKVEGLLKKWRANKASEEGKSLSVKTRTLQCLCKFIFFAA